MRRFFFPSKSSTTHLALALSPYPSFFCHTLYPAYGYDVYAFLVIPIVSCSLTIEMNWHCCDATLSKVRYPVTLLCFLPAQLDVLVDKAPLQRRESTPACLVELAGVRADMRADAGTGVNRIGVVGPLVDKLVLLLPVSSTV